jgi:hypothetical protein
VIITDMKIADYIRGEVLQPRLKESGCLVLYDPHSRFRNLAHALASEDVTVVDASESSIESREAASRALRDLASRGAEARVLIYVPSGRPATDEQKQSNPFSVFAECGAVFPEDDSEEYQSLCIKAKPEYEIEIRQKFRETADPSFAVIDAIGGGTGWPQLRTVLGADSPTDILVGILSPTAEQQSALKNAEGWQDELRDLLKSVLGMKLVTKAKQRDTIATEVWRYVLFSEFVFDLPGELPAKLAGVPRAPDEARTFVDALCDFFRKHRDHRSRYVEIAETVEGDLDLRSTCAHIEDLGVRDTFPFEERTFLRRAAAGIKKDDLDVTRQLVGRAKHSVWRERHETVQQWELVEAALELVQICEDLEPDLGTGLRTIGNLVALYTSRLRTADRAHRALERAAMHEVDDTLDEMLAHARKRYRDLTETVQAAFIKHVEAVGWPVPGVMENASVFDKVVAPMLTDKGRRVALIIVDAFRYELGAELQKELSGGEIELRAACASLPTITPVGMASLLPGSATGLFLSFENESLVPRLKGAALKTVAQRMDVLRKKFGDRFKELQLVEFLQKKKLAIADTVDLLVLRTNEIDSVLENEPTYGVKLIPTLLKDLNTAIAKVRKIGFRDVVVVTDHGFVLNAAADVGDLCPKPATGQWTLVHDRMLVGEGEGDVHSFSLPVDKLGVTASFSRIAGPRSMAPYRAGVLFFHGGLSLQEAIVPVLKIRFTQDLARVQAPVKISVSYKGGQTKKVTTRLPVIAIAVAKGDLFSSETAVELRVDAIDKAGAVVAEPRLGAGVDPSTHTITMHTGEQREVVLRMSEEFEGKFQVRVLDPQTMTAYDSLDLETSYTV